jgi:SAM-dependent methyltransferase
MPTDNIQRIFTGQSGLALLAQSVAFVRSAVNLYARHHDLPIGAARVLDYGCGWGRLMRLFYKYVPAHRLFGVDPNEMILKICRETGMRGSFARCDYIPKRLPFGEIRFDLIYSFSVFTHLSERTHKAVLDVLHSRLADDGVLVLTTRSRAFWDIQTGLTPQRRQELLLEHESKGYAFSPGNIGPIDGEITYGETTISRAYMDRNWQAWEILEGDWNHSSPYQLVWVLQKRAPKA